MRRPTGVAKVNAQWFDLVTLIRGSTMSSGTKQLGEFLVGMPLAERIKSVAEGGEVRCAVAFWSAIGVDEVFPGGVPDNTRIICDISMGSTSAKALKALGAPDNPNLRHSLRMHAKVFISDEGLVVGSANASASALGDDNGPIDNTEAGIFHSPDSASWKSAAAWFDNLLNKSPKVTDDEIEWAKLIYRPKPPVVQPRRVTPGSLFDLVAAAPWRFSKVGFAFTSMSVTKEQQAEVRKQVEESWEFDQERIGELDDDGTFFGWDGEDVRRWPEYFFLFWQPGTRLSIYGKRVEARVPKTGSLMTSNDWRGLRASCDVKLPPQQEINRVDAKLALKLRGEGDGGVFYANGSELAERIAEMRAESD
jgi:hypothetical protein